MFYFWLIFKFKWNSILIKKLFIWTNQQCSDYTVYFVPWNYTWLVIAGTTSSHKYINRMLLVGSSQWFISILFLITANYLLLGKWKLGWQQQFFDILLNNFAQSSLSQESWITLILWRLGHPFIRWNGTPMIPKASCSLNLCWETWMYERWTFQESEYSWRIYRMVNRQIF